MTQMSEPGCPTSHNYSPRLGNSDSFDSATDAVVENHRTRQKRQAIVDACQHGDIGKLRTLAQEDGGFLDDETRRLACRYHHSFCWLPKQHTVQCRLTLGNDALPQGRYCLDRRRHNTKTATAATACGARRGRLLQPIGMRIKLPLT
jgi:hypothetical protein